MCVVADVAERLWRSDDPADGVTGRRMEVPAGRDVEEDDAEVGLDLVSLVANIGPAEAGLRHRERGFYLGTGAKCRAPKVQLGLVR